MLFLEDSQGNDCHIKAMRVSRLIQLLLELPPNSWILSGATNDLVFYRESPDFNFGDERGIIDFNHERVEIWEDWDEKT